MPGFIGKKLCPELIFVEPHFEKYREASATIRYPSKSRQYCVFILLREIFFLYDPHFEPLSLDEASLNITDYLSRNLNKSWEDVVREIQALVIEKTQGLTCSCGVSCNRRLAKLAADVNKPNGYYFIPPHREAILNYLNPLPVRKLSGIGKVTEQLLNGIGIHKVEDIYFNRYLIAQLLRQNVYESYIRMALGIGGEKHSEEQERKSIGRQKTFRKESRTPILLDYLKELSEKVASDLQKENLRAKSLTLVLKCSSFELRTRATTLPKFISTSEEIFAAASELFIESSVAELRLLGTSDNHQIFPHLTLGIRLSHFEGEEDESSSTKSSTARITSFFPKATKEEFLKMIDTESKSPLKSEKPNKASKYERPPKPLSDFFTRLPKDPNDNKRE